ncbi:hypothetical protein GN244_ATG05361 [Phytophthora infestans]|uniref:RxLR effector PexRD54 WY domain-containing protein n=1 Tax=Phytophthora infestans TaxID=4787 RepID=A0A833T2L7_PHYIN|nr:hypothetical protein GN244_ATG05361 [Phytophthora infestans]
MSELIPDESALVNMLIKAKGVASTEKLAQRVQAEQTKSWLQSERMPDDLFTLLRLDKADNDLLANPIYDAWIKYADDFREMYLKISMDPIATIDEHYSIAQVARMIVKATESKTQKIAYRLNTEQYRDWLKRYHPAEAFMNLELGAAGDKLFRSPLLATWLKYVDFYNRRTKGKVSVTSLLRQRFGDEKLDKILVEATTVPATNKIALELLRSLRERLKRSAKRRAKTR